MPGKAENLSCVFSDFGMEMHGVFNPSTHGHVSIEAALILATSKGIKSTPLGGFNSPEKNVKINANRGVRNHGLLGYSTNSDHMILQWYPPH